MPVVLLSRGQSAPQGLRWERSAGRAAVHGAGTVRPSCCTERHFPQRPCPQPPHCWTSESAFVLGVKQYQLFNLLFPETSFSSVASWESSLMNQSSRPLSTFLLCCLFYSYRWVKLICIFWTLVFCCMYCKCTSLLLHFQSLCLWVLGFVCVCVRAKGFHLS